jgi:hypothetical protein
VSRIAYSAACVSVGIGVATRDILIQRSCDCKGRKGKKEDYAYLQRSLEKVSHCNTDTVAYADGTKEVFAMSANWPIGHPWYSH